MKKSLAVILCLALLVSLSVGLFVIAEAGATVRAKTKRPRIAGIVHRVEARLKERAQQITGQRAQRASSHPSDDSSYPLSCCHCFLLI